MASTAADLVKRVRRRIGDWPEQDVTTASLSSTGTSLTVSDTTAPRYFKQERIEIDYETMVVDSVTSATALAVIRGAQGSTAVAHVTASNVLVDVAFTSVEILDYLNEGLDNLWPFFYQELVDESLSSSADVYEYTVPTVDASGVNLPLPRLKAVEMRASGMVPFKRIGHVDVIRSAAPKIRLGFSPQDDATIRLIGYAPLPHLSFTTSTHAQLPYQADGLIVDWAVGMLLMSGEARRVRFDQGAIDNREQATRVGASMAAARDWRVAFYQGRSDLAMPPMQPHIVITA